MKAVLPGDRLLAGCCRTWSSFFRGVRRKYPIDRTAEDALPVFDYSPGVSRHRVYAAGRAETGALGLLFKAPTSMVRSPKRLFFAERNTVNDVACGFGFTLLAAKSKVYGCGINTDCQLGLQKHKGNTLACLDIPAEIPLPGSSSGPGNILSIAAGRAHCLVLTDEAVFSLGNNAYGQCGRPVVDDEDYSSSGLIHRFEGAARMKIKAVECGQDHSFLLAENGAVFSCGWGADGQTGLGHYDNQSSWCQVKGDIAGERITKVSGTSDCTLAINDRGELFGWGNSEYGQLQTGADEQQINLPIHLKFDGVGRVVDIAAGGSFCALLNDDGKVFVWGYGILGKGPQVTSSPVPVQIPDVLFGKNEFEPDCRVVSIACGVSHIAALNNKGDVYAWGKNRQGCLCIGHENDQFFPFKVSVAAKVLKVACGLDHTILLAEGFV